MPVPPVTDPPLFTEYDYITTYDLPRVTALCAEGYTICGQFGDEYVLSRPKKLAKK